MERGEPVEILSETTPTERLLALPDGTMQYEVSTVPVRVADGDGDWVDIDLNLVNIGEWWEPAASATPVRFGAGGSDLLDEVQTAGGEWITERWPHGILPAPAIDGATATYPEVFPGVDLKLTATEIGMASVYVVKSADAADNVALEDLHVQLEGADISREPNGTFAAETDSGYSVVSATPLWWDSADGGNYLEPGDLNPAVPVEHTHTESSISLDVGETIEGEDLTYPIFIDPDWSAGENSSWYTDVAYPNASYLNAATQRVGKFDIYDSRMYMEFPISALAGKEILTARLNTTQLAVAAWPNNPLQVRLRTNYQNPGFTWNQQNNSYWGTVLDTQSPGTWGGPAVAVGWNVTAGVKTRVAGGSSAVQFGFIPQDPSAQSRRHFDNDATLIVTYNTPPKIPTTPSFITPNAGCPTSATSPVTISNVGALVLRAGFSDPDGGNVKGRFRIVKTATPTTVHWTLDTALGASGNKSVTVPAGKLADGKYAWAAQGVDPSGSVGKSTGWCYFNVDSSGPQALPTIAVTGTQVVGAPLTATFTTSLNDAVAFIAYTVAPAAIENVYAFDVFGDPPACGSAHGTVKIVCPNSAGVATATVAPTESTSTLWAVSYDVAGNPARLVGATGTPGTYGRGYELNAANSPEVSFARGHVWRTQAASSPLLSAAVADTHATAPRDLSLGQDTHRTVYANAIAPTVDLKKPVLRFQTPPTFVNAGEFTVTGASPGDDAHAIWECVGDGIAIVASSLTCDQFTGLQRTLLGYSWGADDIGYNGETALYACDVSASIGDGTTLIRLMGDSACTIVPGSEFGVLVEPLGFGLTAPPTGGPTTTSAGPVVSATQSFTASAWVKPGVGGTPRALSTDDSGAGFRLGVSASTWHFCLRTAGGAETCASEPRLSDNWTYLTGVWDATNGQLRLYADGDPLGDPVPYAWPSGTSTAAVPVTVGAAVSGGVVSNRFAGLIADPGVLQGVATRSQLLELRAGRDPLNG